MDRTIKPSEIKAVVETAYNKYKDFKVAGAAPDPRVSAMNPGKMSVSVCLTAHVSATVTPKLHLP